MRPATPKDNSAFKYPTFREEAEAAVSSRQQNERNLEKVLANMTPENLIKWKKAILRSRLARSRSNFENGIDSDRTILGQAIVVPLHILATMDLS